MTFDGFAFTARKQSGDEFLIATTAGKSRNKAKMLLRETQNRRHEKGLPLYDVACMCAVRIEVVQEHEPSL